MRGTVPGGGDKIHVPVAGNNTSYPGLAGPLSAAVRKRLARSGVEVVGSGKGAPRLEITIVEARGETGMLTTRDDRLTPVDTIWHIIVEARITRLGDDEAQAPEQFEAQGRAYSGGTVLAEESLGHRRRQALLDDLADAIATYFFELNISPMRDK
ncbi:MAG: hypothetical protein GY854_05565 [Deltaproteobacteria bacterium]|nr:hypothetical protein [Deltaproteobacteria bacterium]